MQVAEFPPAVAKLDTAEPVSGHGDTGPAGHFPHDLFFDAFGHVGAEPRAYLKGLNPDF